MPSMPTTRTRTHRAISRFSNLSAVACLAAASVLVTAPLSRAQNEAAAEPPPPPQPIVAIEHMGLERIMPDPRDAGLVRALAMLGDRLKELKAHPSMGPDAQQFPDEAIDLFDTLLTSPMRMGVTLGGFDEQTRLPMFGVVVSFLARDKNHATALHADVEHIRNLTEMQITPEPSQRWNGMQDLALPFGMLSYGPRQANDGWRYELILGDVDDPGEVTNYLPAIDGNRVPAARAMLDLAALTPVSEMLGGMAAMFAPQGGMIMQQLRDQGMVGPDAMRIEMTSGYTDTHGIDKFVVRRAGKFADALHISRTPLTPEDLAIVPADATFAQVRKMNIEAAWTKLRTQISQAGGGEDHVEQTLAQFKQQTGVDLEADIIASLGDTLAIYISDSTGGGSFLSTVLALRLDDPERLGQSLSRLTDMGNAMAEGLDLGPGALHLQTKRWTSGSLTTVRFRGLPIPLEPAFAVAGNWLLVGASSQACVAAANQAMHARGSGLKDNPSFAAAWPRGVQPIAVEFIDIPRTLRSGYTPLSLLSTALTNFVASPDPEVRDPGAVLPPYATLAKNARPFFAYGYWAGDDLIVEMQSDPSVLANVAGMLGVGEAGSLLMGGILGAGITAAAMEANADKMMHESYEHQGHGHTSEDEVEY